MWECPDLFRLDGQDVLLYSPQGMQPEGFERLNKFHTGYRVGRLDSDWRFEGGPFIELDNGHDFYAAQTLLAADGRRLLWAWLDMWDSPMPSQAQHWCGMLGVPRELQLHEDRLHSYPARELAALRQAPLLPDAGLGWAGSGTHPLAALSGDRLELELQLDLLDCHDGRLGIALRCSADGQEQTLLYYDAQLQRLVLDRSRSGAGAGGQRSVALAPTQEPLRLRVFLDRSSIEVFAADGSFSLSSRIYPQPDSLGLKLFSTGSGRVTLRQAWHLASGWVESL
jgi:beta-fructofuranosidase